MANSNERLSKLTIKDVDLLILASFILISPLLYFIPFPALFIHYLIVFLFLFFKRKTPFNVNEMILISLLIWVLGVFIRALWFGVASNFYTPFTFFSSILVFSILTKEEWITFVKRSSNIFALLLAGSIIGFVYVAFNGSNLFSLTNLDGRINYFFPFTLSNSYWGSLMRPSGIYDEPGTFSFFICALVTLRSIFHFSFKNSLYILLAGCLTLSLAHVFYTFLFLLSVPDIKKGFKSLFIMIGLTSGLIYFTNNIELFKSVFLYRFRLGSGTTVIQGDNRTSLFFNAIEVMKKDRSVFMSGIGFSSLKKYPSGNYGNNPLSMIIEHGILVAFSYYQVVFLFLKSFIFSKRYITIVAFGFLLLQREYIFIVSYAPVVAAVFVAFTMHRNIHYV